MLLQFAWHDHCWRGCPSLLLLEQFDGDGEPQGTALWQVDHIIEKKKGGLWLQARLIAATDEHLQWWLTDGPGKDYRRNFVVHLCATPAGECRKTKRHREQEFHSDTFRDIPSGDIIARKVSWFTGSDVKSDIDGEIAILAGTAPPYDPAHGVSAAAAKPGHLEWEADHGAPAADTPAGEDIPGRLSVLRKIMAPKEKEAEPRETPNKKKKPEHDIEEVDREGRGKSRKRGREHDPQPVWFGHAKVAATDEDESSSDGVIPKGKGHSDRAKDRRTDGPPKETKRKKGKRPKKGSASARKSKHADRGPFGIGHRVSFPEEKSGSESFENDDEDSGSDFRVGPSTKSRQLQLQEHSEQHPGRRGRSIDNLLSCVTCGAGWAAPMSRRPACWVHPLWQSCRDCRQAGCPTTAPRCSLRRGLPHG